jgi:ABC-type transporter Mla subunit MlaD
VLLPTANLLRQRAQVSYAGSPVGEVTAIGLRPDAARVQQYPEYPVAVTITMQGDVPLRQDARVELRTDGFIGERYVDISPGTGPLVPPGGTVLGSIGGLEGLLASFSGVGGGLGEIGQALRTLLADPSQPGSLPATLASVNRLLDTLLPRLVTLTTSLDDLLQGVRQDVASTSATAGGTLQQLDATIAESRTGLKRSLEELNTTLVTARQTVAATRPTITALQRFVDTVQGNVTGVLGSLRATSDSLQRSTEELSSRLQKLLANADAVVLQNDRNFYTTVEHLRDIAENLKIASQLVRNNPSVILWGTNDTNPTSNPGPGHASRNGALALQDRGRIGRYDRTP